MAIKIGKESTQSAGFSMYQGVGAFNVVAVNPTKEELGKLQNFLKYLWKAWHVCSYVSAC